MQKPFSNPIFWISILANIATIAVAIGIISWMGGYRQFMSRLKNRGLSTAYEMDKSQQSILPTKQADLLFLGNSLIANGHWTEWFPDHIVLNRGIRGDGIEGVMRRLDPLAIEPPKEIVLLIGINDLAYHDKDWVISKYKLLLKQLKTKLPITKVLVQSILPVNNHVKDTGHSNLDITLINKELEKVVVDTGYRWLDLHPLFSDGNGNLKKDWTLDGLHLTGIAYQKWTAFLKKQIAKNSE